MRRLLKILAVLVVVLIVAIGAFIAFLPTERIATLAVEQVKAATGRDLTLAEGVSPSFYPVLGIETGAVTLSNADWAEAPNMISTSSAKVGIEVLPLLSGSVRITEIRLIDPVIALEISETGEANWDFQTGDTGATDASDNTTADSGTGESFVKDISLGQTVIENGTVSFTNRGTGQTLAIAAINASVSLPALDQDMAVTGEALWNGEATAIELTLSTPQAIMSGASTQITLAATAAPLSLTFDGLVTPPQAGDMPALSGKFSLAAPAPAQAVSWASGTPAPDALLGLTDLNIGGDVAMDATALTAAIKGGVARDGHRATLDLRAESQGDWAETRAFNVNLVSALDSLAEARFTGNFAAPDGAAPSGSGTFSVAVPDLKGLAAFAGAALPDMGPDALNALAVEGRLDIASPSRISAELASVTFDAITASGSVAADLSEGPVITADLVAGDLDLRPYVTDGGQREAGSGEPGWSRTPIDLSGLGAVSGDFKIRAASVKAPQISLGRSDIRARLANGALRLNIQELGLYGGGLKGDIALDGANDNAVSANINAATVRLLPMLKDVAGVDMVEGLGQMDIAVRGGGRSLHDIMNSLDGKGGVKLTDGALVGYNLAAMVRNVQGAFGGASDPGAKTDFSEISATFDIENGVMTNADFAFLGPLLRIAGEGTVDLGGQAIDFRLVPKAVTSLKGQGGSFDDKGLAFPLLIKGPWSAPSIRPDLKAGIDNLLKDPEGAVNAAKDVIEGVKGLKDGGGIKDALGGLLKQGGSSGGESPASGSAGGDANGAAKDAVKGVLKGLFGSD